MASTTKGRRKKASKRSSVRSHLRPWARDALGIGLVVVALLAILELWFGSAGPVGAGLDWLLHATFGIAAVVFPILALFWGLILLRGTAEQDRLRMFIGFAIAAIGVLALSSLWQGNPRTFGSYEARPASSAHSPRGRSASSCPGSASRSSGAAPSCSAC